MIKIRYLFRTSILISFWVFYVHNPIEKPVPTLFETTKYTSLSSERVEARVFDGHFVTSTKIRFDGKPVQNTIEFASSLSTDSDCITVIKKDVLELEPTQSDLDVYLFIDIDPTFLSVPPGNENSSYYYLALAWDEILSSFNFSGQQGNTDIVHTATNNEYYQISNDKQSLDYSDQLYNWFVNALPSMTGSEQASLDIESKKKLLDEKVQYPQIVVVLRWKPNSITETEYRMPDTPLVVIDIDRSTVIMPNGPEIIGLGKINSWLDPDNEEWKEYETKIRKHIRSKLADTLDPITSSVRNVFVVEQKWPLLIDSEQLEQGLFLKLEPKLKAPQTSLCTKIHFFLDQDHNIQVQASISRLNQVLGMLTVFTCTAFIFLSVFYATCFFLPILNLCRSIKKSFEDIASDAT